MNRANKISSGGRNEKVADWLVNRLLPNDQIINVGPFVSMDHVYPIVQQGQEPKPYRGQHAHPHRGIVTFSYLLSGSLQHVDSRGHHCTADSGGALWMKAGNGIIHDERLSPDFQRKGGIFHALQFWINLPAVNKLEEPEFKALFSYDFPELELPDNAGVLRVVLGSCGVCQSPVKTFSGEFIYHLRLNPKSAFAYTPKRDIEYAVLIPADEVHVNGRVTGRSHLLAFINNEPTIHLYNPGIVSSDAFIFGGNECLEPIVAAGPFVMNSRKDIAQAYADFFAGRYGELKIDKPFQNQL
ncbi:pirin family protein [Puia dinghuensis]|uniref:Quercetin 2,3-dioxygenase n=1 Tax=Puia dinghuensis TaxID=1792502 RepID=A0A8J2UDY0_9BACT|nr:pirin family protein [Puia dinghuensis]GGB02518.1 quercetin 2,3-dioxygenase [Puia dinghuensis]